MPRGRGRNGKSRGGRMPLHTKIFGRKLKTKFDPPTIVDKPWNSATIIIGFSGDKTVVPSDVSAVVNKQLGLVSTQTIEFRILKIRVWALYEGRPLRVNFVGFGDSNVGSMTLEDWPSSTHFPHVGYQYPASVSLYAFNSSQKTLPIMKVDVGTNSKGDPVPWIAYIDMLWRSDVYNPIASSVRYQFLGDDEGGSPILV